MRRHKKAIFFVDNIETYGNFVLIANPIPEQDWPSVANTGEEEWLSSLTALKRSYSELCQALSQVSGSLLDQAILPGHSSLYVTLHGLVQHNLYHAGQIALLKKA